MKKLLFSMLFSPLLLIYSCTKDDDPDPDLAAYNMVFVEGGSFIMGCTDEQDDGCYENEKPTHIVTLDAFYIGKYEVTQKEWTDVMVSNPSKFAGCEQCPVEQVSWEDVQEFLVKLNEKTGNNFRLPTEAEWEYAARGGNRSGNTKYSGSDEADLVAWHDGNSEDKTHPVGQRKANELGLCDMSGNIQECCQDWFGPYSPSPQNNPSGPTTGNLKVARGGSFGNSDFVCRIAVRYTYPDSSRFYHLGFRLAH